MKEIKFKTVLSSLKKGDRACYRAVPVTNGSVDLATIATNAAARGGMDPAITKFVAELLFREIGTELSNGIRVEIENIFSGSIAVGGTFPAANSPWDKSRNRLIPYFTAKGDLKTALAGITGINVTEGNHAAIKRVLDTVRKEDGVIAGVTDVTVYVSGQHLLLDPLAEDEGCWLEAKDGTLLVKGNVTGSTATTLDCVFPSLPESGKYALVVATRGGLGSEFGVSIARKNVEVVNEAENNG